MNIRDNLGFLNRRELAAFNRVNGAPGSVNPDDKDFQIYDSIRSRAQDAGLNPADLRTESGVKPYYPQDIES